jgi:hypothetical protein
MPYDSLRDFLQQRQIEALNREMGTALRAADASARQVADLQETVDRLVLTCHAMRALLGGASGVTDDDLLETIREIDMLDGVRDNRLRKDAKTCPRCQRPNNPRRLCCLYCGGPMAEKAFS